MRLVDLDPRWTFDADGRRGMGVSFDCPCTSCRAPGADPMSIHVPFTNPIDGGAPFERRPVTWQREGDTFETLTLTPSVDASHFGHWHGFIRNGEIV
jgi:hypothetical protein